MKSWKTVGDNSNDGNKLRPFEYGTIKMVQDLIQWKYVNVNQQ